MIETFPSGLYTWPDDRCMLIVAPEYTTLVRVDAPNQPIDVAPSPVTSLHPLVDRGLVLLCGEAHIAAFDSSGLRWSSARIAWDGLDIDRIEGDAAIGTAWNPVSEDGTAFSVDLRTGAHEGGSWDESIKPRGSGRLSPLRRIREEAASAVSYGKPRVSPWRHRTPPW